MCLSVCRMLLATVECKFVCLYGLISVCIYVFLYTIVEH